ncbi:GMC oxidoreductase [Xylaria arbuscula]|nr:GMC oxidoreductase [Xylaria arbuscula]
MRTSRLPAAAVGVLLATGSACGETFDYIIAGAGTSGLVLANRLSANPSIRVAVIEPGEDVRNNINVTDPALFTVAYDTPIDWQYSTTPQPAAGNRSISFHAGKAIGGTSTINGMTYIRGDKPQFDAWETALGNTGWNWESLYPYYKKAERFTLPSKAQAIAGATYDAATHGEAGHVHTGYPYAFVNGSFHDTVAETWAALGYAPNEDVNAGSVRGFSSWPQTLDRDRNVRFDAARAYYYDVEDRPNLTLIKGTVKRIVWDRCTGEGKRTAAAVAGGVEYVTPDGELVTVTAAAEVILSAGALRSPLILESSGVGNPSLLDSLGIKTEIDLPGVGEYLQEQPNSVFAYADKVDLSGTALYATFSTAQDLFGDKLSSIEASTSAQIPAWAEKVAAAASPGAVDAAKVEKLFRVQHDLIFKQNVTLGETLTAISVGGFVSALWLLLPFSWGSVHLASADAINAPAIDPKYFFVDFDLNVQIGLGRQVQKFWNTEPVSKLVSASIVPADGVLPLNATDQQWASYIGDTLMPNHHPIGTASMMSRDLGGVVDPELKVYGTDNVRVVDGSILPLQFSGHLTATLYAVAERAAEIILEAARY